MVDQDSIRTQLQVKIFDAFGKSVTLNSKTATTYNDRGEEEIVSASSSTVTIVPYNVFFDRQTHQAFGELNEGEMDAAVPYDVTIAVGDTFTIDSEDWEIRDLIKNYLPDNVVTIIRIAKVQP